MMVAATMPASSSASAVCGGSLSTHRSPGSPGCTLRTQSGWSARPKNIVSRSRRDTFAGAQHDAAGRGAVHGGAHHRPRVAVAERHVGGQRDGHPRVAQRNEAPQLVVLVGGYLGQVLVTALGDEIGLGTTVTPSSARSARLSSDTTAACSMRSRGWVPAARRAAMATTSWAAVTQCTATGCPV